MPSSPSRYWNWLAYTQIAVFTVCLGYWLFQTEFPYIDAFRVFDYIGRRSWADLWSDTFRGTAEFRPFYYFAVKAVHDAAGGPSVLVFRTIQLGAVVLCLGLFRTLLNPRGGAEWFGFTLGACCLVGLHTATTLSTSQPLPYTMVVNSLVFGSVLLLRQKPGIGVDVAAATLSAIAVFLIEYGVVVGLMFLAAGIGRLGAARRRTALIAFGALVVYGAIRLSTNTQAIPGPFYTETGLFFRANVTVAEQQALFAGRHWLFSAYNVLATLFTVFFSEPRAGVYYALDAVVNGTPVYAWQVVQWTSSLMATILVGVWIVGWNQRDAAERRVMLLGVVAIAGNVVFGYMYTRDRIPTVAGAYYALLVGLAATAIWRYRSGLPATTRRLALTVLLVLLAGAWAFRAAGTIVWARDEAWAVRDEWTDRYERESPSPRPHAPPDDARTESLRQELRHRSVNRVLRDPRTDPRWMRTFFERGHF